MKFRYQRRPTTPSKAHPKRYNVLRPIVPIRLINNHEYIDTDALIDSGSDDCIFWGELGEAIGLDITSGDECEYKGLSGEKVKVYFHNITLEVGGHQYECYAGFSYETGFKEGILGQNGFFNLFTTIFDLSKETIELKQNTNGKETNR